MHRHTAWMVGIACAAWLGACGNGAQIKPDDKSAKPATRQVETKPKVDISRAAREAFADAVTDYIHQKKSGNYDYERLLASFERALEQDPRLAEAHYNMGCIYEAMHKDKEAASQYKKALEIRPDLTLAAANWGALLARHGKLDQALLVYKKALHKDSRNSAVLLNMAGILRQQGQHDQALKYASDVLIRDPGNVGAYRIMASVYYDKGDMDMAHLICLRGLKVKDKDPRLLNTLGLVLLELGKVPEALAQFRAALEQVPDMVPTRFNVAKIALDYRDFRVAKDEFSKILEYQPDNRKAAIGLGIAMRGVGEYDAARAHFEALAAKHPEDPLPHYWIGEIHMKNLNDPHKAMEHYKRFVKLSGGRLAADHPVYERVKLARQNIEMERKMKEMEKKMAKEAAEQEKRMQELARLRKKLVDDAWARREKEGMCMPPAKLEGDKLPFVLVPLAVPPDKKSKVRLAGMEFKPVKKVEIGTLKAKWHKLDETTIEMIAPKGLGLGAWDVMITFEDRGEDPLLFQGGLWVCKTEKKKEKQKDASGKPGEDTKGDKGGAKAEPGGKKGVQEGGPGGAEPASGEPGPLKDLPDPAEPREPEGEPEGEPKEPQEPKEPAP